jgi:hypothetical protein
MNQIRKYWDDKPLTVILVLAIVFRLVAVIFSRGWGMHDDHFLIIEPAQAWADGINYNHWLPGPDGSSRPDGHSMLYSGLHYFFFVVCGLLHFNDPQSKMLVIRFFHAAFSMITIYYGYKLTYKLAGKDAAKLAGLLIAVFWIMPFLSVRNLVEVVCIPFMLMGIWFLHIALESKGRMSLFLIAGIIMGLGFSIRFQTAVFISGTALALIFLKQWKPVLVFSAGVLISLVLIQGLTDYFIWGYAFAEVGEYIRYNLAAAKDYITGPWYLYILFLGGILIPPVSIFLFTGFFRVWKKHLLIFLPVIVFLVFHSVFPNKQERFILPVIPFIFILGSIGWTEFVKASKFWNSHSGLLRFCWIFFWIVNTIALLFVTPMYSKKARVESMVYLSRYKNIHGVLQEDIYHSGVPLIPQFYLKQWIGAGDITQDHPQEAYSKLLKRVIRNRYPRFVLFYGSENIDQRVKNLQKLLPGIVYETTIYPGFIDDLLFRLNPRNTNQTIIIYRNTEFFPIKISSAQ